MNSAMLVIMALGSVSTAATIIGAVVVWGYRHGTLRESDQERYDRRFADIMRTEGYHS